MARFQKAIYRAPVVILGVLAFLLAAEAVSWAAKRQGWTQHDLAYYLSQEQLNFIRPGLVVKITSATIQDGRISVRFRLTDPAGQPLDREGIVTPGPVSTSWVIGYIPKDEKLFTSYITRIQTSPITSKSATQATSDSGGTYVKNADGEYTYNFRATAPAGYDASLTHRVGVYSTRNLTEFELGSQRDDDTFTFVPNGSAVTVVRDVVRTETCNKCHNPLGLHGGSRRSVELCILCHTPQTTDPDTGNTVDFATMIHKIHTGENLPSVEAGTPYQIIGNAQSMHDFSTVVFPDQQGTKNCAVCHDGKGAQSNIYLTSPSRRACGSCHDNVNFATGANHVNLPQVSDNLCANCHIPQGEVEFDASIKGAHTDPVFSAQLPGTTFKIEKVENFSAGQKPRVTFSVTDKAGNVIDATKMNSLSLVIAGPTTDYASYRSESALASTPSGNQFVYNFSNAIDPAAKGTFAIAIQGYKNIQINPGTTREMTVRDAGMNQVTYFSVDGSRLAPRRRVVALENCNSCHGAIALHGGSRRNTEFCVMCHNPNTTDAARRTAQTLPAQSVHFKTMIHKIHTGEENTTDFTVFGFGGTGINFNEVRFPGDRRDCAKCHVGNSYNLPLPEGVLPSQSPRDYINPTMQPVQAACLSCHTSKPAAAHASLNTSPTLGEACDVCHGPSADFNINKAHAR